MHSLQMTACYLNLAVMIELTCLKYFYKDGFNFLKSVWCLMFK